jgi:hypothetical protein
MGGLGPEIAFSHEGEWLAVGGPIGVVVVPNPLRTLPTAPPRFTGARRVLANRIELTIEGAAGGTGVIQISPDLQTWSDGPGLSLTNPVTTITQPLDPRRGTQFYRLRVP